MSPLPRYRLYELEPALPRSASAFRATPNDAASNDAFVAQIDGASSVLDLRISATDRLRIWRVGEPRQASR